MTIETSNTEWIEKLSDDAVVANIRAAMSQGCIRPSHIFDMVDELICRFTNKNKENK